MFHKRGHARGNERWFPEIATRCPHEKGARGVFPRFIEILDKRATGVRLNVPHAFTRQDRSPDKALGVGIGRVVQDDNLDLRMVLRP